MKRCSMCMKIAEKSGSAAVGMMMSSIPVLLCGGILIVASSLMAEPWGTMEKASFAILLAGCGLFLAAVVMAQIRALAEWAMKKRGE